MLDKLLFLYHGTQGGSAPVTGRAVTGGLSGGGQLAVILIVLGVLGWFLWYLKSKR